MKQYLLRQAVRPAFALCWWVLMLTGCGSSLETHIEVSSRPFARLSGEVAVLMVTRENVDQPLSTSIGWGAYENQNAQRHLAEIIAHAAQEAGWAQVLEPAVVQQRLKARGLEPTFEPTPEQLPAFAEAVGCPFYITAQIRKWRTSYFVIRQKSSVDFSLSCFQPPLSTPLWEAHVKASGSRMTDRETALHALKETFRQLMQANRKGLSLPDQQRGR